MTIHKLRAINLDIHLWHASKKRKRTPEEAHLPKEVFTIGSKKIFNPERLRPFTKHKARAERLLSKYGIKQIIGSSCWLVPEERAKEVVGQLRSTMNDFMDAKEVLLADYDSLLDQWLSEHEEYRDVLERDVLRRHEVESKISFKWQAFGVQLLDDPDLDSGLEEKLGGLFDRLLFEISLKAEESWENSFSGKSKVTRRALRPLKDIREKLHGLEFTNPEAIPLLEDIDRALDKVPSAGPIEDEPFVGLQSIILLLMNPRQARKHAQNTLDGQDPEKGMFNWAMTKGLIKKKVEKPEPQEKVAAAAKPAAPATPSAMTAPSTKSGIGRPAGVVVPPASRAPIPGNRSVAPQAVGAVKAAPPAADPAVFSAGLASSKAPTKKKQFQLEW